MPGLTVLPQAPRAAHFPRASLQTRPRSLERYLVKSAYAMGNRLEPSVVVLSAYPLLLLRETNVVRTVNLQSARIATHRRFRRNPQPLIEPRLVQRRSGTVPAMADPTDEGLKE